MTQKQQKNHLKWLSKLSCMSEKLFDNDSVVLHKVMLY